MRHRELRQVGALDRPTDDHAELRRRLGALPDGHPSGPDQPLRLTDAEWSEHVEEVHEHLADAQAAGLETKARFAIDADGEAWTADRRHVHSMIIDELYLKSASVPCDRKAIIAGGLPGAGKTTVLTEQAGIDLSQYLMINPDTVKEEMAKRGLIPDVGGLSPMEASDLVHEEASHIAKQLALRAQADGKNVIWDITMSSLEKTQMRIENLRVAGYAKVDGIFVDIPIEVSVRRADARHRDDHERYRAGEGLGGRCIPPEVIRAQADDKWGSVNRRTFEGIVSSLDAWSRYDNSVDGRPASLVASDEEASS